MRENSLEINSQHGGHGCCNNKNNTLEKNFCKRCKDAGRRFFENKNTDECTNKDQKINERNGMEKINSESVKKGK